MFKTILYRQLLWCTFALTLLIFALGVSWQLSKSANFFYGVWYQTLEINDVIKRNVPKNTQGKREFPQHDVALHHQKFADIVFAIHQHGEGLSDISYVNNQGLKNTLLTQSEVRHLQDVANLLDNVSRFWWANVVVLVLFIFLYGRKGTLQLVYKQQKLPDTSVLKLPNVKQKLLSLLVLICVVVVAFGVWGFTDIFYYLHTVVFPEDHQWFFYYKDSLMATLMKAPDIFAAIATQLILVAIVVAGGLDAIVSRVQRR